MARTIKQKITDGLFLGFIIVLTLSLMLAFLYGMYYITRGFAKENADDLKTLEQLGYGIIAIGVLFFIFGYSIDIRENEEKEKIE